MNWELQMIYEDVSMDVEYMNAEKRRDMEKLNNLVRSYAKSKGFVGYYIHGTKSSNFNKFNLPEPLSVGFARYGPGIYLANPNDQKTVNVYSEKGRVMNLFLNMDNLVINNRENTLSKQKIYQIVSLLDKNKNFSDGSNSGDIIHRNIDRIGDIGTLWHIMEMSGNAEKWYEVLDSVNIEGLVSRFGGIDDGEITIYKNNKIKLADPVTYDDNGEIIPLSQRFDSNNEDIRY